MADLLKKKKELRKDLMQIEKQIYDLETTYLEETRDFGNIFIGWDAFLSTEKVKPKKLTHNEDRLFSLSSFTSPASRREEAKKTSVKTSSGESAGKPGRKKKKVEIDEGEVIAIDDNE